jgi:hypothetical protein
MTRPARQKFSLYREGVQSHIPGRLPVAEGIVFSSGKVVLGWLIDGFGVSVFDSLKIAVEQTCRDGRTELVWAEIE